MVETVDTELKNTEVIDAKKAAETKEQKARKALRVQRDKDREMVKGIFRFFEVPGGSMSFSYKAYKGDPVERFDLIDNQIYSVPLGVARHLNKNGWYPVHQYAFDENNKPSMRIGQKVRRFGFQSLEFVDTDDLTPVGQAAGLAEVTMIAR